MGDYEIKPPDIWEVWRGKQMHTCQQQARKWTHVFMLSFSKPNVINASTTYTR